MPIVKDATRPTEVRQQAARSLGKTRNGALELLKMIKGNTLPEEVRENARAMDVELSEAEIAYLELRSDSV